MNKDIEFTVLRINQLLEIKETRELETYEENKIRELLTVLKEQCKSPNISKKERKELEFFIDEVDHRNSYPKSVFFLVRFSAVLLVILINILWLYSNDNLFDTSPLWIAIEIIIGIVMLHFELMAATMLVSGIFMKALSEIIYAHRKYSTISKFCFFLALALTALAIFVLQY